MSQANELLNGLSDEQVAAYSAGSGDGEGHIVIGTDRYITVPSNLKRIAVQFDHDVETVTFDCPRYWDGLDMSKMPVYINYMRQDGYRDAYPAKNISVDKTDPSVMHFTWTISKNATMVKGTLSFLVCVANTDKDGNEINHWNSELCQDMVVSEGMDCVPAAVSAYPDLVTHLLQRMRVVEEINVSAGEMQSFVDAATEQAERATERATEAANQANAAAASAETVGTAVEQIGTADARSIENHYRSLMNQKLYENLEFLLAPASEADSSVARVKEVPANAAPNAAVNMVGGMTRKCANLIPYPYLSTVNEVNGVSVITHENGTITFSGKCNSGWTFILCERLMSAGNYYLGDGVTETGLNFIAYDVDNSAVVSWKGAFSLTKDTIVRVYYLIADTFNGNCVVHPMLNAGTTAQPYEPYYEGLRSAPVTEVESVGVNLFDMSKFVNAAGLEVFDDKIVVTASAYDASINSTVLLKDFAPQLKVGDTVKFNAVTTGASRYIYIGGTGTWGFGESRTITEKMLNSALYFYASGVSTSATISEIMLNAGTTALPYTPYVKHTLSIPEAVREKPWYGLGISKEVCNAIRYNEDGRSGDVKCGVIVLDGSADEDIRMALKGEEFTLFYCTFLGGISYSKAVSNYLDYRIAWDADNAHFYVSADSIVFVLPNGIAAGVAAARAYLASNPLEIVYELANPYADDISDIMPADNMLPVQAGGTAAAVSEYGYDVPWEITFTVKN